MMSFTRGLTIWLTVINWICIAVFAILLVLVAAHVPRIDAALSRYSDHAETIRLAFMGVMALAVATGVAAHVVLRRLTAIVDTVRAGRPFVADNAARLRMIGFALLVIQVLDLGYGAMAMWLSRATGEYLGWSFGLTGWLAVLFVFVLARVFELGARMQDDVEATV